MELIEAFEKLSLHVRSNRKRLKQNATDYWNEPYLAGPSSVPVEQKDLRNLSASTDRHHNNQFHQFEDSIETLFTQINELDRSNHSATISYLSHGYRTDPILRKQHPSRKTLLANIGGSLETSLEEDSDNSSQKSHSELEKSNLDCDPTQRLLVHLMKRDIGSITDSVRRICRILALGSEIESIYQMLFWPEQNTRLEPRACDSIQQVEPLDCRALCKSFLTLCSSEPYVCDLPTVKRFAELCQVLMQQADADLGTVNSLYLAESAGRNRSWKHELGSARDHMCLDETARDALDCALLECDQSELDANWTDNKLYVDGDNR